MSEQEQISFDGFDPVKEEYRAFTEKFKPKKTTDDCYTPPNVYSAVADWVAREYGLDRAKFLRPFRPGGDYQAQEYPEDWVVVDNPPFSILTQIQRWYIARGVRFFLFAPTLTLFSGVADVCYLPVGVGITYENGAVVNTSFVTNLDAINRVRTAPELYQAVLRENRFNERAQTRELPKYSYPPELLTAAAAYQDSRYGIDDRRPREEAQFVRALDAQRAQGKAIFGGGFLLSERAAAERAAAERAAATRWPLSEREKEIIRKIGGRTP